MKNELHLKIVRLRSYDSPHEKQSPDKGPWIATRLDNGLRACKNEYLIFSILLEETRELVRNRGVVVHLYNYMQQPLLTISPENVELEGLYSYNMHIEGFEDSPTEIDRPICPNCQNEAGLEPAHWKNSRSEQGQWRWVCVDCDFAVSSRVDSRFEPTGRLASRGERRLRAQLRERFASLWGNRLMSRKEAYELLNKKLGTEKRNRVNFASMTTPQLLKAMEFVQQIVKAQKINKGEKTKRSVYETESNRTQLAGSDLIELYDAITHEPGEPTYLGDGVYLYPDGKLDGG